MPPHHIAPGPLEDRRVVDDSEAGFIGRITRVLAPDDPTPLYHQIASAIRWEIGMGRLPVGAALPALRELSAALQANYHTVREAYSLLTVEGVLDARRGAGTRVVAMPTVASWTPTGSVRLNAGRVFALECNRTQAEQLAVDVEARFFVSAVPWLLDGYDEPPPGTLLCTSFHAGDLSARWPHRTIDSQFVDLELDPTNAEIIEAHMVDRGVDSLTIVERDRATGSAMAAEVRALLDERWSCRSCVIDPSRCPPSLVRSRQVVVFAPRVWDALPAKIRSAPGVLALRFRPRASSLEAIERRLGWNARHPK